MSASAMEWKRVLPTLKWESSSAAMRMRRTDDLIAVVCRAWVGAGVNPARHVGVGVTRGLGLTCQGERRKLKMQE